MARAVLTRRERQEQTREELVAAAARVFARQGYHQARVEKIAAEAGFSTGAVYSNFEGKEELFLSVVEEASARAAAAADAPAPSAPTAKRLRAILTADVEWVRAHEDFARVLVREAFAADPRFYPKILAAAAPFIERVLEILRDGAARGEVRADVPVEQLALTFTGLGELALVQHWGSGGAWPQLEQIPDYVTDLFLAGAAPRTSASEARRR